VALSQEDEYRIQQRQRRPSLLQEEETVKVLLYSTKLKRRIQHLAVCLEHNEKVLDDLLLELFKTRVWHVLPSSEPFRETDSTTSASSNTPEVQSSPLSPPPSSIITTTHGPQQVYTKTPLWTTADSIMVPMITSIKSWHTWCKIGPWQDNPFVLVSMIGVILN
jgi:hypothetical protein